MVTYILTPSKFAALDNQSNRRIQNKHVAATHKQQDPISKRAVSDTYIIGCETHNTRRVHQISTHIFCVHIRFGADQKLSHWQMTIAGSPMEQSVALKTISEAKCAQAALLVWNDFAQHTSFTMAKGYLHNKKGLQHMQLLMVDKVKAFARYINNWHTLGLKLTTNLNMNAATPQQQKNRKSCLYPASTEATFTSNPESYTTPKH